MRRFLLVACLTVALIPVLLIGGCYFRWWQFDHLEQNARRAITPAELQEWGTNILASVPNLSPAQIHQLRTNYPAKLSRLCRGIGGCWISVHEEPITNSAGIVSYTPRYVMIIWSIKPSGDAMFEVGPTNFVSVWPQAHVWAPGVYFCRR